MLLLLLLLPALALAADPVKQTLFGCNEERVELLCPAHTRCWSRNNSVLKCLLHCEQLKLSTTRNTVKILIVFKIEELLFRRWDVDVDKGAVQGEHRAGKLRPVLAVHLQQPGGGQPQHPVRLQQGDLQHPALQVE